MDTVTGVDMAIAVAQNGGIAILPRFDIPQVQAQKVKKVKSKNLPVAASIGIKEGEWSRLKILVDAGVDHINLDVAHGHLETVVDLVKKIRKEYPRLSLSAGVVATYQGAFNLFKAGADVVTVGIGPGSICTTRIQTGSGVPQFTAITEASRAARKFGKIIWANGGTKNSGDVVKCLAAGASAVICGNIFAGTDEAPPKIITIKGKKYKPYNGSTSLIEKQRQLGKNKLDKSSSYISHVEGVSGFVPYKGPLSDYLKSFLAGVRSGYSYSGAFNTPDLWEKAKFCQVSSQALRESNPHDIIQL